MKVYAAVIKLDTISSRIVSECWQELARGNIGRYMIDNDYQPHVTLGVCDKLDNQKCFIGFKDFAGAREPFTITLSSFGFFIGEESALFLGVTPTKQLIDLHAEFHDTFCRHAEHVNPYFSPENWVPHCSLAVKMSEFQVAQGVEVIRSIKLPIKSVATEIAIIEAPPWRELAAFPLMGK